MRALKGEERALWREAMRGVRPLRGKARAHVSAKAKAKTKAEEPNQPPPSAALAAAPSPARGEESGWGSLDRRTAQKLKRGSIAIEARLDLHGMTQSDAHAALTRFIAHAQKRGTRAVLVITGKSGVLHGAVPRWLEEGDNRARILALSRARAQHGGEGALYIFLRRQR